MNPVIGTRFASVAEEPGAELRGVVFIQVKARERIRSSFAGRSTKEATRNQLENGGFAWLGDDGRGKSITDHRSGGNGEPWYKAYKVYGYV